MACDRDCGPGRRYRSRSGRVVVASAGAAGRGRTSNGAAAGRGRRTSGGSTTNSYPRCPRVSAHRRAGGGCADSGDQAAAERGHRRRQGQAQEEIFWHQFR